jgi:hypothetical protein
MNSADWNGNNWTLPPLKKAADKAGAPYRRPPRGPITKEHIRILRQHLDISTLRGAAIWAVALCAYWGCRRLGELLPRSALKFSLEHDITRHARITFSVVNRRRVFGFHLPWTKTTGIAGGEGILTATGDMFCGVEAVDNHFRVNHSPDLSTPMFAYRDDSRDTGWSVLTKYDFLKFTSSSFLTINNIPCRTSNLTSILDIFRSANLEECKYTLVDLTGASATR